MLACNRKALALAAFAALSLVAAAPLTTYTETLTGGHVLYASSTPSVATFKMSDGPSTGTVNVPVSPTATIPTVFYKTVTIA